MLSSKTSNPPPFAEAHSPIPGFMEFAWNSNQDGEGSHNDVPF